MQMFRRSLQSSTASLTEIRLRLLARTKALMRECGTDLPDKLLNVKKLGSYPRKVIGKKAAALRQSTSGN